MRDPAKGGKSLQRAPRKTLSGLLRGRLAEWSNAPRSKRGWGEIPSEVRILHLPHFGKLSASTSETCSEQSRTTQCKLIEKSICCNVL